MDATSSGALVGGLGGQPLLDIIHFDSRDFDIEVYDVRHLSMVRKRTTARLPLALPGSTRARKRAAAKPVITPTAPVSDGGGGSSGPTPSEAHRQDVAVYVAAGGDESVQRVITAVHG